MSEYPNTPHPRIKSPADVSSEEITAMSERIAANARPVEYPDRTSEAARDQGWGPTERGTPIEDEDHPRRKPEAIASEKAERERRKHNSRQRETRFTDIGSDTHDSDPAYLPTVTDSSSETNVSRKPELGIGHMAVRRAIDAINAVNIMNDSGNDPILGMALARVRQEKPRN